MTRSRSALAVAVAIGGVALAAPSLAARSTRAWASVAKPSPAALAVVRGHVERWLSAEGFTGFEVSEVMAFTNNDYIAVRDKAGKPAFELLIAPDGKRWLIEEPASMMWNTRYGMLARTSATIEPIPGLSMMWGGGMMGSPSSWYSAGAGKVPSVAAAIKVADRWLAEVRPGEHADRDFGGMGAFPGYYTLDTTLSGKTHGMLSVNASTGAVWYHGWHGSFLAEREFSA